MKLDEMTEDEDGFFFWVQIGIAIGVIILCWGAVYYLNEAGFWGNLGTSITDLTDMLVDGELLGDWLAGIIIGILSGLFNWGKDHGYSIFSSS